MTIEVTLIIMLNRRILVDHYVVLITHYIFFIWNQMRIFLYLTGKVYAVGGHDGNEHLGSMEMFDPLTNKWMMKASMNTKR